MRLDSIPISRERFAAKRRRSREYGGSLVEQAFTVVVVLTLIFAIIDFGRALYTYHFVSNAAREATRWASVRGQDCSGLAGGCPASSTDVQTYVSAVSGMGLDATKITATPKWGRPPTTRRCAAELLRQPGPPQTVSPAALCRCRCSTLINSFFRSCRLLQ